MKGCIATVYRYKVPDMLLPKSTTTHFSNRQFAKPKCSNSFFDTSKLMLLLDFVEP